MKILVAGGAGYIGSHTCKALAEAGHTPIVYDNLSGGHEWAVKWGPFERGDLHDAATLGTAMKRHRPDAVIDFAGLIDVGESAREPTLYYRHNVGSVITLLEQMRAHDVGSIVFSSSCATYGLPSRIPIDENTIQAPINNYGRTKLMAEMMLRDACAAHGLAAVALRYFNASGADEAGELGEEHHPETHLIPLILQTAAGLRPSISVYGTDYDTPDGTCIRDYIHVTDLASAHVAALSACTPGKFAAYNLGSGKGASINEVVELARRITGRKFTVAQAARREGDPPRLIADASLAATELKWRTAHSDPDHIVRSAWRWMTEHRQNAMK